MGACFLLFPVARETYLQCYLWLYSSSGDKSRRVSKTETLRCDFAQFAALIALCGSLWQHEQQPDVSIDLAAKRAIHAQVKE